MNMKSNNSLYDHRIFYPTLVDDRKLEKLLKWLSEVPAYSLMMFNGSFDSDPAILTLKEHKQRAKRISEIIPKVAELGVIPAINVLQTMGHGNKRAPIKEKFGFQPIVGSDGVEVEGAVCALDESFLKYVYEMYRIYAQTGALHIWTDDDVRISNHGQKSEFCFCPLHIKRISDETGLKWVREKLVDSILHLHNKELWQIWYKINSEEIINLFKRVEKAVHKVNPDIRIGIMPCGCSVGRNIDDEIKALKGKIGEKGEYRGKGKHKCDSKCAKAISLVRPGGGYWNDDSLTGALRKRISIRKEMPLQETEFETSYELENHPYWSSLKSIKAIKLEMDLNFIEGIDRIALNIFDNCGGQIDREGIYKKFLCSSHNFHAEIKKAIEGKKSIGIYIPRNEDSSFNAGFNQVFENFARIGIPIGGQPSVRQYSEHRKLTSNWSPPFRVALNLPKGRTPDEFKRHYEWCPATLYGRICETIPAPELRTIINKGAVIDGSALKYLIEGKILNSDDIIISGQIDARDIAYERFTDHPLNAEYKSETQQVWGISNPIKLEIKNEKKFSVLSEWIGVDGNVISPAAVLSFPPSSPLSSPPATPPAPSLIFPYNISGTPLLTEARAFQIGCFLSMLPDYKGIWIKELNCYPVLWRGDKEIVVGIARFSLDSLDNLTIWLSPKIGKPGENSLTRLTNSGKWGKIKFLCEHDHALNSGSVTCLKIKTHIDPMSVTVLKWETTYVKVQQSRNQIMPNCRF